ncbi:MAG: hypothetical protein D6732_09830 [Methanobacteriota archaeon]|nr:MAG: hypothetical protein D6732_09830 [Euryarchaeota archaeon]
MSLVQVKENKEDLIGSILKSRLPAEEAKILTEDLAYIANLDTSLFFSINLNETPRGFMVMSIVEDFDEETGYKHDLLLIEEIWLEANAGDMAPFADEIVRGIISVGDSKKVKNIEVMINEPNAWLKKGLENYGFKVEEIHAKKIIPFPSSVEDIFDLINQSLPFPKVIQLVAVKGDEELVDFVDTIEEINELLESNWNPELFHVVLEPDSDQIDALLKNSVEIVKWDEIEFVYRR